MAPTLATTPYLVTDDTAATTGLVTTSFTPAVGEVLVVKAATNDTATGINTPTGGGLTYTLRGAVDSGSFCYTTLFTAVVGGSPSSMTVTQPFVGDPSPRSLVVERWTNAALDATPAVNSTKTGTGAPSATLTTENGDSVVSWVNADWNAQDPTSRAYRSSATESGFHHFPSQYVAYYGYQSAVTVGSKTMGLTAPTGQRWALVGVEVMAGVAAEAQVGRGVLGLTSRAVTVAAPPSPDATRFFMAQ